MFGYGNLDVADPEFSTLNGNTGSGLLGSCLDC